MNQAIASVHMSLDGVIEHPERWSYGHQDDEAAQYAHQQLLAIDALVMGRRTYETFAAAWPGVLDDTGFALRIHHRRRMDPASRRPDPDRRGQTVGRHPRGANRKE